MTVADIDVSLVDRPPCSRVPCEIDLLLRNLTERPIRAVRGHIEINDVFGDPLVSFELEYTRRIAAEAQASATFAWRETAVYSPGWDATATRLKNSQPSDLSISWWPETILFEDGEALEDPLSFLKGAEEIRRFSLYMLREP